MWQQEHGTDVAYILENVPSLENVSVQLLEDAQVVCQHLGKLVVVDATTLSSYVHQSHWKWTNLAHVVGIKIAL